MNPKRAVRPKAKRDAEGQVRITLTPAEYRLLDTTLATLIEERRRQAPAEIHDSFDVAASRAWWALVSLKIAIERVPR